MSFSDIHTHILYGTDDGAKTREQMLKLLDTAYKNGVRLLCLTPHFHPGYFGDNRGATLHAFEALEKHCAENYPDLTLFLGNELFYTHDSISWMKQGLCLPMGSTRYVLVEFAIDASEDHIAEGIDRLLNIGYIPIIAHAERYKRLSTGRLWAIKQNGVLVQVNDEAFRFRTFDFALNKRVRALLAEDLVDFVSSDCHDEHKRPPDMTESYNYLVEKYGREKAERLCYGNAYKMLCRENGAEE